MRRARGGRSVQARTIAIATLMVLTTTLLASRFALDHGDGPQAGHAAAQPMVGPVLMLSLSPASVEVRPTENSIALQFTGTADVQQPLVLRSTVTLSASCYWPAIVSPSTLEFQGSYKQSFTINVVVPPGALPKQRQFLEVDGSLRTPGLPLETANATAAIYIVDYPVLVVQYDVMETKFKAGKTYDIRLGIESKASEDLDLVIGSSGDPGSMQAELKDGTVTIPARGTVNVTVRVSVPKGAEGGAQTLNLRLTATTGDGGYEYKMLLNVPCEVDARLTSALNKRGLLFMVVFVIVAVIALVAFLKGSWRGGKRLRRWRAARRRAREGRDGGGREPQPT